MDNNYDTKRIYDLSLTALSIKNENNLIKKEGDPEEAYMSYIIWATKVNTFFDDFCKYAEGLTK